MHRAHCLRHRCGEHDTSFTAKGHSWFDTPDGHERCGRCHYFGGNEALFDCDDSASETDEDEEAINEADVGTDEGTDDESDEDDEGCEGEECSPCARGPAHRRHKIAAAPPQPFPLRLG